MAGIIEESWLPVARTLGFNTERDMLMSLYVEEDFSIKEIAKVIGYNPWSVRRRLLINNIVLKPRGGPNKTGKRRLIGLSDEELFNTPYKEIATRFNIHHTTVFAERKLRRKEGSDAVLSDKPDIVVE